MEFPSLAAVERERFKALGIDPEKSYQAWQRAIKQGEISPRVFKDFKKLGLPPRALEAAKYLAEGLTRRQVAKRMCISEETVKDYAGKIRAATGKPTTVAAIHVLFKKGVL